MLDRSKAPAFHIPDSIRVQQPEVFHLPNGIPLYAIPTPEIEIIRMEICVSSTAESLLAGKRLIPFFTLEMLTEGTHSKNAEEIAEFLDTYAAEVDTSSGFEYSQVNLTCTKKHFLHVLPLFREMLTDAVFPERELSKKKRQKSLQLSLNHKKTGYWASQLFKRELFGHEHVFGQIPDAKDADLVQQADLLSYYHNSLWANPAIFLTGNIGAKDIETISLLLGNLPIHTVPTPGFFFENQPSHRIYEAREESQQSSMRLGCHIIPNSHPDHLPFSVMNTLLGGFFGSRLSKNIREDKGHTYGIYSAVGSLKNSDYWLVAADIVKTHCDEVFSEIYLEIDRLKQERISKEEIETLRNFMAGKLLSQFNSNFEMIGRFKSVHLAGLDLGYFQDQLDFILKFDENDIQTAAQRHLDTAQFVEILVG